MTLRLRLTLLYGAVFIAAGAGLLAATYELFKHSQTSQARTVSANGIALRLPAGAVLNAYVRPGGPTRFTGAPSPGAVWTQIHAAGSGEARAVTSGSGGGAPTTTTVRVPPQSQLAKAIQHFQSSGQKQFRRGVLQVVQRANVQLHAQQAGDASSLLEWSAIALGVVALLSIALAWWLSGRALRPLRTMNSRAREISAENLNERLGVDDRRDELGELANTFDALLARLESAFESQRRFVANASHELRTPITLERTLVEVALADPDASVESLRRVCERVVTSTEEQERLLDALLTLARSEAGIASGEVVDLALLAADALVVREQGLVGISVETSLEPAPVIGDQALLERLLGNLLDNAIVHNDGGDRWISISTGELDGAPGLRIANGGQVVEPDEVDQLFEPFRRGVGDRLGGGAGGLGLGLSIVRAVATAHGGEIEAQALPEGGLAFELRFTSAAAAVPGVAAAAPGVAAAAPGVAAAF